MKNWSYLAPGDVIDIVAPASPCPRENLEAGVNWITENRFTARVPPGIIDGDVFFAAPLKLQLELMKEAVYSDSKMLWSLRGGYGSMRLIPFMEKWKRPRNPKLFMGFSDVTALHLFFGQRWGWPTIHGRNVSALSLKLKSKDRNEILPLLQGKKEELTFRNLRPLNDFARKSGVIRGPVTGGNLKLLQTSIGTSWELEARGKILFAEDVGERGYAIDRMLEQLTQARLLGKGIRAMVFGDFIEGEEKNGNDLTGVALERFAVRAPFPVYRNLKCGHGEVNFSLPFHTEAEIHGKTLRVKTGGV